MAQLQQFYYHQDPVVRKYLELNNEDGYGPAGTKWFKLVGDFDFDSLCSTLPPKPLLPLNKWPESNERPGPEHVGAHPNAVQQFLLAVPDHSRTAIAKAWAAQQRVSSLANIPTELQIPKGKLSTSDFELLQEFVNDSSKRSSLQRLRRAVQQVKGMFFLSSQPAHGQPADAASPGPGSSAGASIQLPVAAGEAPARAERIHGVQSAGAGGYPGAVQSADCASRQQPASTDQSSPPPRMYPTLSPRNVAMDGSIPLPEQHMQKQEQIPDPPVSLQYIPAAALQQAASSLGSQQRAGMPATPYAPRSPGRDFSQAQAAWVNGAHNWRLEPMDEVPSFARYLGGYTQPDTGSMQAFSSALPGGSPPAPDLPLQAASSASPFYSCPLPPRTPLHELQESLRNTQHPLKPDTMRRRLPAADYDRVPVFAIDAATRTILVSYVPAEVARAAGITNAGTPEASPGRAEIQTQTSGVHSSSSSLRRSHSGSSITSSGTHSDATSTASTSSSHSSVSPGNTMGSTLQRWMRSLNPMNWGKKREEKNARASAHAPRRARKQKSDSSPSESVSSSSSGAERAGAAGDASGSRTRHDAASDDATAVDANHEMGPDSSSEGSKSSSSDTGDLSASDDEAVEQRRRSRENAGPSSMAGNFQKAPKTSAWGQMWSAAKRRLRGEPGEQAGSEIKAEATSAPAPTTEKDSNLSGGGKARRLWRKLLRKHSSKKARSKSRSRHARPADGSASVQEPGEEDAHNEYDDENQGGKVSDNEDVGHDRQIPAEKPKTIGKRAWLSAIRKAITPKTKAEENGTGASGSADTAMGAHKSKEKKGGQKSKKVSKRAGIEAGASSKAREASAAAGIAEPPQEPGSPATTSSLGEGQDELQPLKDKPSQDTRVPSQAASNDSPALTPKAASETQLTRSGASDRLLPLSAAEVARASSGSLEYVETPRVRDSSEGKAASPDKRVRKPSKGRKSVSKVKKLLGFMGKRSAGGAEPAVTAAHKHTDDEDVVEAADSVTDVAHVDHDEDSPRGESDEGSAPAKQKRKATPASSPKGQKASIFSKLLQTHKPGKKDKPGKKGVMAAGNKEALPLDTASDTEKSGAPQKPSAESDEESVEHIVSDGAEEPPQHAAQQQPDGQQHSTQQVSEGVQPVHNASEEPAGGTGLAVDGVAAAAALPSGKEAGALLRAAKAAAASEVAKMAKELNPKSKKGKKGKVKIPKKGLPALASEGGTTTDVGSSQEGFSAARSAQAAGSVDGVLGEAASQARPVAAPKEGLGARLIASLRSANATGTSTAPTSLGPASPSITSSPKEARGLKSSRSKRQVSGVLASSDYDASGTLDKANDGLVGSSNVRGVDTAQEADTDDDDAPKSLRKPSAVQRFLGSLRQQPSAVQPSASSTSSRRPSTEKGAGAGDEVQRSGHSSLSSTQRSQAAAGDQQSKPGLLGKMMGSLRRNKAANDVTAFEGEPTSGSDEEGQSKDDDEVPQWRKAQSAASGASSSAKPKKPPRSPRRTSSDGKPESEDGWTSDRRFKDSVRASRLSRVGSLPHGEQAQPAGLFGAPQQEELLNDAAAAPASSAPHGSKTGASHSLSPSATLSRQRSMALQSEQPAENLSESIRRNRPQTAVPAGTPSVPASPSALSRQGSVMSGTARGLPSRLSGAQQHTDSATTGKDNPAVVSSLGGWALDGDSVSLKDALNRSRDRRASGAHAPLPLNLTSGSGRSARSPAGSAPHSPLMTSLRSPGSTASGMRTAAVMSGRSTTADDHREHYFQSIREQTIAEAPEEDGGGGSNSAIAHIADQLMKVGLPPSRF